MFHMSATLRGRRPGAWYGDVKEVCHPPAGVELHSFDVYLLYLVTWVSLAGNLCLDPLD